MSALEGFWDDAKSSVKDWWNNTEDSESTPKTQQQQTQSEKLADGSALPRVATATDATGETVLVSASRLPMYSPLLIGGGVAVLVLLVFALMMKRG